MSHIFSHYMFVCCPDTRTPTMEGDEFFYEGNLLFVFEIPIRLTWHGVEYSWKLLFSQYCYIHEPIYAYTTLYEVWDNDVNFQTTYQGWDWLFSEPLCCLAGCKYLSVNAFVCPCIRDYVLICTYDGRKQCRIQ